MSECQLLIQRGDMLFGDRSTLMTHWQDIAENFYPQRADFTVHRHVGQELAGNLNSSYPILVHRELSSSFASMLRKRDTEWFRMTVDEEDKLTLAGRQWLDWATRRQRQAMYDSRSQFIRATTEGDGDFAAFGQCVISHEIDWNKDAPHLLYRSWHLRDCAWAEGYDGQLTEMHIRWKPRIEQLKKKFRNLHSNVEKMTGKDAMARVNCRRVVIRQDIYPGTDAYLHPWKVVYIDVDNEHIMQEEDYWSMGFVVPRWQTVSGSQYAYSPAAVAGLPDARLLQAMTLTLLEAGEMAVRPPLIATSDAIREDVQWFPGGITWAEAEYDERKGDVLRPISQDKSGLPFGYEAAGDQRSMLAAAFYLNKLTLPPMDHEMTATEVRERIQEYIRGAIPLFEPMEVQYNAGICENTFEDLMRAGWFGSPQDIPAELQGQDVRFQFSSPLHDAIEAQKAQTFLESKELLAQAVEMDPNALADVDIRRALRDALIANRAPAIWLRDEDEADAIVERDREMAQMMAAGAVAEQAGRGAQAVAEAENAG